MNRIFQCAAGAALAAGIVLGAVGCTRQVYVPVESVRTDTLFRLNVRVDSVTDRDSVYVGTRGDTLVREVYRFRQRIRERVDTVYHTRVDTLRVPVPVTVSTQSAPRESWWRRLTRRVKDVWSGAFLLIAIAAVISIWRKLRG